MRARSELWCACAALAVCLATWTVGCGSGNGGGHAGTHQDGGSDADASPSAEAGADAQLDSGDAGADGGNEGGVAEAGSDAAGDAAGDAASPGFALSASPMVAAVRPGSSTTMTLSVARTGGFAGAVTVTASNLPAQVTASPVTIAATASSADMTFDAGGSATVGGPYPITLTGADSSNSLQAVVSPAITILGTPGTLDTSFATGGRFTGTFGHGDDEPSAMALESDGKIVVGGSWYTGSRTFGAVMRLTASGALDTGFGAGGVAVLPLDHAVHGLAIQSDGKIVLACGASFSVMRLTASGSIDTNFGSSGEVNPPFPNLASAEAEAITVQPDGKIVVVGSANGGTNTDFAIARLTPTGALDTTFDSDGLVTTAIGSMTDEAFAVVLVTNGGTTTSIYAGGDARTSSTATDFAIAKYDGADGSLDNNFGSGGKVQTDMLRPYDEVIRGMVVSGGKLLVAGYVADGGGKYGALARYDAASGALDTTLSSLTGARLYYPYTKGTRLQSVALQPDGKIVYGGTIGDSSSLNSPTSIGVGRFNADGTIDKTFEATHAYQLWKGSSDSEAGANALLQPDGKILVSGTGTIGGDRDFAVLRYNSDGTMDTTFGTSGVARFPAGGGDDRLAGAAVQPDGKAVLVGSLFTGGRAGWDLLVLRLDADGALDTSFASSGVVQEQFSQSLYIEDLFGVTVQQDGNIVAAGAAGNFVGLMRLRTNGALDKAFGTSGIVKRGGYGPASSVVVQPDGRIVAGCPVRGYLGSSADFHVFRFTSSGAVDTAFGSNGVATLDFGGTESIAAVGLDSLGRIVAAGTVDQSSGTDMQDWAIARLLGDGTADSAFDSNGMLAPSYADAELAWALGVQPDDKLVVAGTSGTPNADVTVARFDTAGVADSAFGTGGVASVDVAADDVPYGLVLEPSGRIAVAGHAGSAFLLAGFTNAGAVDSAFGSSGTTTTTFTAGDATAHALAAAPDGRLVAAGSADDGRVVHVVAARYWP